MNDILIKDASLDDMSFFWSSILNHFRHSSPSTKLMTDAVFFGHHQPIVEAALKRKGNVQKPGLNKCGGLATAATRILRTGLSFGIALGFVKVRFAVGQK